ncbi:MAG: homocysteine S-methyltransferase family protein [Candidatus Poribacteria bacterium]|nr:homocysteine S-methyltransferase family protein [Candidatus Poribacteria bacterium]
MASRYSDAYQRIQRLIAADQCVILDGGVATELERTGLKDYHISDKGIWGTWTLYHAPYAALEVHRRYVAAGCDLISTFTWGIMSAPEMETRSMVGHTELRNWLDVARLGVRLARQAIDTAGKTDTCAVAFSLNGDIDTPQHLDRLHLLKRVFAEEPPDLIVMETMSLIREGLTLPAVELMLQTGLPVWLSFRRCRYGVCGVYGQHWGGPEGDLFGRTARKFEDMGIGALLINCLPVDHLPGMVSWLRDFTDMPLGAYPNLGRYLDPGWAFDDQVGPDAYAALASQWREEGAQIVGGCCGVTPEHIAAMREKLEGTTPGNRRVSTAQHPRAPMTPLSDLDRRSSAFQPWVDEKGRILYPLPFPEIVCDPGVFRPTQGSFLIWKHLFRSGAGKGKRCLDVGCGTGILTVQLALNGANHVQSIDIQREAVANTLTNAFRNGVSERVNGKVIDLYTYLPNEKYDLVVASLYQMPVDPTGEITSHRPADFWGRNMLDHLILLLPEVLEDDGVAYLMQISALGQLRTAELLNKAGFDAKVIDFSFFHFSPVTYQHIDQIRHVEELSDAFHLTFGEEEVMVMYLLELTHRVPSGSEQKMKCEPVEV